MKQEAEKHKFMVFIPHFDLERFPLPDYQEVGVMNDKDHTIRPAESKRRHWLIKSLSTSANLQVVNGKDI